MSNTFSITGNIGEPRKSTGSDGKPVINLSVADTPRRKNDRGEWEDAGETMWVDVPVWGDDALELAKHVTKGSRVTATGRLQIRTYQDKDGNPRTALELKGATVGVVPRAPREQGNAWGGQQQPARQQPAPQQSQPSDGWGGGGSDYDQPPF